jgi:hypothetical protein
VEKERFFRPARFPVDAGEQIAHLPDKNTRIKIVQNIYNGLVFLLSCYGIEINRELSGLRVKTEERTSEKIARRGVSIPLRDIYGIRLICLEQDRDRLRQLIQSAYPLTPKDFPDGKPSWRDYSDPVVREFFREKHNPHTSSNYSALHINIAFLREDSDLIDIAEVQVMTKAELDIYNLTREEYLNNQNGNS